MMFECNGPARATIHTVQKNLRSAILYSLLTHFMLIFFGVDIPITSKNINNIENKSFDKLVVYLMEIKAPENINKKNNQSINTDSTIKPIKSTDQGAENKTKTALYNNIPYNDKQLSKRPQPRSNIDLELPSFDGKTVNGKISAYVVINELGKIVEIEIINNDLPHNVSEEILAIYSRALFFPGEVNGKAVSSKTKITIKVNSEEYRSASDSITRFESIK